MKSVIITGANRGIGLDTTLAFARAGYKVFATMRDPGAATVLREKVEQGSLNVQLLAMDVNSDESVSRCMGAIYEQNSKIDVLVNNAGIERHGAVEDLEISDFKAVMETNYFGLLRCTKAVLPQMRGDRDGCIINITSVAGRASNTPLGPYSASKFAVEAISEALAQEMKPFNVRVAIVEPGIIDTDMARDITVGHSSHYPQANRFGAFFIASLKTPTSSAMVADKILEIAESNTWQLRYPVGPDAAPFLGWRASKTDEQWIDWHSTSDEEWYNTIEKSFGVNARDL